jgi:hypothetical protein
LTGPLTGPAGFRPERRPVPSGRNPGAPEASPGHRPVQDPVVDRMGRSQARSDRPCDRIRRV